MKDTTIAVDIAKDVFEIAISKEAGRVDEVHRVSRAKFLRVFANRESARVVMEACGSAHHWAREIKRLGHRVVLLPPHTVRPYVQRSKTDRADVKGSLEEPRYQTGAGEKRVSAFDHSAASFSFDLGSVENRSNQHGSRFAT